MLAFLLSSVGLKMDGEEAKREEEMSGKGEEEMSGEGEERPKRTRELVWQNAKIGFLSFFFFLLSSFLPSFLLFLSFLPFFLCHLLSSFFFLSFFFFLSSFLLLSSLFFPYPSLNQILF